MAKAQSNRGKPGFPGVAKPAFLTGFERTVPGGPPAGIVLLVVAVLLAVTTRAVAVLLTGTALLATAVPVAAVVAGAEARGITTTPNTVAAEENTVAPPWPELPSPEEIQRRAAEILAGPKYAPPRWQTWVRQARESWSGLWARLRARLGTREDRQEDGSASASSASASRWRNRIELVAVAAGALVVLILGYWVARRYRVSLLGLARIRTPDSGPPNSPQSRAGARGGPGRSKEASPWPAADRLAADGDYLEALRLIYKELLAAWEKRRLVADHQYRTDRQVGELICQFAPKLYPEFMSLSRIYASCWYGRVPASPEIFAEFRRRAQRLMEGSNSLPR